MGMEASNTGKPVGLIRGLGLWASTAVVVGTMIGQAVFLVASDVGDVAVTHYHLTEHWIDKSGRGEPRTIKVTHTWLRTKDTWQIIGGMAAVVPTEQVCD